jgi:hypothetical protein
MVQPKYALYIFIKMTLCVDTRAILNCHHISTIAMDLLKLEGFTAFKLCRRKMSSIAGNARSLMSVSNGV